MSVRVVAAVALLVLLGGCDSPPGSTKPGPSGPDAPVAGASATPERSAAARSPELQRLPRELISVPWGDHGHARLAPSADAALPSVLGGPGPPARVAWHPLERWDGSVGWATERILFLGRDGRWRVLDLSDLGLPEAWWPGNDTFGPGSLSADGRTWAAHTNAGVVVVDLTTGTFRHVAFPASSPMVRYVDWNPGQNEFAAYARKAGGLRYSTFQVGTGSRPTRAAYDGSRTRFDTDGTPVEVRTRGRTLTLTRWGSGGPRTTTWALPFPFPRETHYPAFGDDDVALIQPARVGDGNVTVWVFDKRTGRSTARLRVPPAISLEGWTDTGTLAMYVDNRWLVTWNPATGRFSRLLEVPPPYPQPGEWAASTVTLPGR